MKPRIAVLPVAGLGTRFLPATKVLPKEMLPVLDKPLIQYAVEEAWSAGMERVVLVTSRGKYQMEDHFDHHPEIEWTLERRGKMESLAVVRAPVPDSGTILTVRQDHPLGLGHAIWCARHAVGDEPFAIMLPDDLIWNGPDGVTALEQMVERFVETGAPIIAAMTVAPDQTDKYGILDPEPGQDPGQALIRLRGLVEKPAPDAAPSTLAIVGRYILTPDIFDILEKQGKGAGGEIQLTDALETLLKDQPMFGYAFQGTRFDCGDKAGFQMANMALALERPDLRSRLIPFLARQLQRWQRTNRD